MQKYLYCTICGKPYAPCPYCEGVRSYAPWRNIVDSADHFKLFTLLTDYALGKISKEETREALSHINIEGHETWGTTAGRQIAEVMGGTQTEDVPEGPKTMAAPAYIKGNQELGATFKKGKNKYHSKKSD